MSQSEPKTRQAGPPFWVPVLTHYDQNDPARIDADRMLAHLRALRPFVREIMLAGSTGDGWEIDDARFDALISLAKSDAVEELDLSILFGILQPTTDAVVARLNHLERALDTSPRLAARCKGAVVCPPVDPDASQTKILEHYEAVFTRTRSPIAVYQLPQVTGCAISPETFAQLARHERVTMFKDSSGEDVIAKSGLDFGETLMVRGAEGDYLEALKPAGVYDGWLLSTGNSVPGALRGILDKIADGDRDGAKTASDAVSRLIADVFAVAEKEGGANAFSNANRAMDHRRAFDGARWREAPRPLKVDGSAMSRETLEEIVRLMEAKGFAPTYGYLSSR